MTGYKQPPSHSRFKKGQSGNPKGRPKKGTPAGMQSTDKLVLQEGQNLITVREGGTTRQIPMIQAALLAEAKAGLSGNAFALRNHINRFAKAEEARQRKINEQCDTWEELVAEDRAIIAAAKKAGRPIPTIYPHPDDVVIDREKGVRFIGPVDKESAAALELILKYRDLLFLQSELDDRLLCDEELGNTLSSAGVMAFLVDKEIPPRLRLSETEWISRKMEHRRITKRELLTQLRRGWRSLGFRSWRRGRTFPPAQVLLEIADDIKRGRRATPLDS